MLLFFITVQTRKPHKFFSYVMDYFQYLYICSPIEAWLRRKACFFYAWLIENRLLSFLRFWGREIIGAALDFLLARPTKLIRQSFFEFSAFVH